MELTGVGALIAAVLTAVLSKFGANEAAAWGSYITRQLVKLAVKILPVNQRERFAEEWQSLINDLPGMTAKFFAAVGFFIAADRMRREAIVQEWLDFANDSHTYFSKLKDLLDAIELHPTLVSDETLKADAAQLTSILESVEYGRSLVTTMTAFRLTFMTELLYRRKINAMQTVMASSAATRAIAQPLMDGIGNDLSRLR